MGLSAYRIYSRLREGQLKNLQKIEYKKALKKQKAEEAKQAQKQVERLSIEQKRIDRRLARYERHKMKAKEQARRPSQKKESQIKPEIQFQQYIESRKPKRPYNVRETGIG